MFRCRNVLAAILLVVVATAGQKDAFARVGNIVARLGPGTDPHWSPDGRLIAFVADGYLQVTPADGKGPRTKLTEYRGVKYLWASDSEIVWAERLSDTTQFNSITIRLNTSQAEKTGNTLTATEGIQLAKEADSRAKFERAFGPFRLVDGTIACLRARGRPDGPGRFVPLRRNASLSLHERRWPRVFVKSESKLLPPDWGDIWLGNDLDSVGGGRRLTYGRQLRMIHLSPKGDKIAAWSLAPNGWLILDTLGNILNPHFEPVIRTAEGLTQDVAYLQWSPDDTRLCYLRTLDDGNVVREERLLVSDISQAHVVQLSSPDWGEIGGFEWAPGGMAVVVATAGAGIIVVEAGS